MIDILADFKNFIDTAYFTHKETRFLMLDLYEVFSNPPVKQLRDLRPYNFSKRIQSFYSLKRRIKLVYLFGMYDHAVNKREIYNKIILQILSDHSEGLFVYKLNPRKKKRNLN